MRKSLLHLVLFFSLISGALAQDGNAVAFHQVAGDKTILIHKGDFLKITALDSSGKSRLYRGTFKAVESGNIRLKNQVEIPLARIERIKIRPHDMQWAVWGSFALGLLLLFVGFVVSLNGLFPPKGQLENSGLETGPRIMLVGVGMMAVLFPILINTSFQRIQNLKQDWSYEVLSYTPPPSQAPQP